MARHRHSKDKPPARLKPVAGGYTGRILTVRAQVRLRRRAHKAARRARARLPVALRSLRTLITTANPLEMVMTLAGWAMYAGVGAEGVLARPFLTDVHQADIELLLAVMATTDARSWGRSPAFPPTMQAVVNALQEARDAFGVMRMGEVGTLSDPAHHAARRLQERVRAHTQLLRNWGFFDRVIALSEELYGPLDGALDRAVGFRASEVIGLYRALGEARQAQYSDRFRHMRAVFAAPTVEEAVAVYFQLRGEPGSSDDVLRSLPADVPADAVRAMLLTHADHSLAGFSLVNAADAAAAAGLPAPTAERILFETALRPQAAGDDALLRAFLDNPVWSRPALAYGAQYAVPTPQLFFSHVHRVLGRLFVDAGLARSLQERRAQFLEDQVEALLSAAFPQARLTRGTHWQWGGRRYETDLIMVLDKTVLIVEAKSGAVSPSALRGAPDRLKKHVDDLIGKPAVQASRLRDVISLAIAGNAGARMVTDGLGLPPAVDTVLRLTVTLEDLSFIAPLEADLKEAGWLDPTIDLAPVIALADLECVLDLLHQPALALHYFQTRDHLQKQVTLLGDELDCLGSYLADGLVIPAGPGRPILQILGESAPVERYYIDKMAGFAPARPARRLPESIKRLLAGLGERTPAGWTTIALAILAGLDAGAAAELDAGLEALRESVPRERLVPDHLCSMVFVPNAPDAPMVLYYVFCAADRALRHERVAGLAGKMMADTGRRRCVFVGRMVEQWDLPYAFCGLTDD